MNDTRGMLSAMTTLIVAVGGLASCSSPTGASVMDAGTDATAVAAQAGGSPTGSSNPGPATTGPAESGAAGTEAMGSGAADARLTASDSADTGSTGGGSASTGLGDSGAAASTGSAATVSRPNCATGTAGVTNCGAGGSGSESCCTSLPVTGGTFDRTYTNSGAGATGLADPATVSAFRLDKYLVTVGRFRQYVNYLTSASGAPPANGSGIHTHLNAGRGLANSGSPGTYETGWNATDWNALADSITELPDIATGSGAAILMEHEPGLRPGLRDVDDLGGPRREPARQLRRLVRGIRVLHLGRGLLAERSGMGIRRGRRQPAARISLGIDRSRVGKPVRDLR